MRRLRRPRMTLGALMLGIAILAVPLAQFRPVGRAEAIQLATRFVEQARPDFSRWHRPASAHWDEAAHAWWIVTSAGPPHAVKVDRYRRCRLIVIGW